VVADEVAFQDAAVPKAGSSIGPSSSDWLTLLAPTHKKEKLRKTAKEVLDMDGFDGAVVQPNTPSEPIETESSDSEEPLLGFKFALASFLLGGADPEDADEVHKEDRMRDGVSSSSKYHPVRAQ